MMWRAKGNMIASRQQRDSATVVLQGMVNVPITVTTQNTNPVSNGAVVGISMWQLLFNTKFWENYKDMWDQVKLMGFRCRIIGNSAASTVLASGLSSVGVVTAVDRTSIPGWITAPVFDTEEQEMNAFKPAIVINPGSPGNNENMINTALSYGSCKTKNWSPGNAFYQWVSIYPSTLEEKESWIATNEAVVTGGRWKGSADNEQLIMGYPSGLEPASEERQLLSLGASGYVSGRKVGFNPVLFLGIYNIPQATGAASQTFTFSLEYKIPCTFRGARSGNQDAAAVRMVKGPSATPLSVEITENGDKIFDEGPYNPVLIKASVVPKLNEEAYEGAYTNGSYLVEAGVNEKGEQLYMKEASVNVEVMQDYNILQLLAYTSSIGGEANNVLTTTKLEDGLFWNKAGTALSNEINMNSMIQPTNPVTQVTFTDDTIDGFIVIARRQEITQTETTGYEKDITSETLIWSYMQGWGSAEVENSPWDVKGFILQRMGPQVNVLYATWRWNSEKSEELRNSITDIVKINIVGKWEEAQGNEAPIEGNVAGLSITPRPKESTMVTSGGYLMLAKENAFRVTNMAHIFTEGETLDSAYMRGLINIWR